jgi:hypothetical protein
MAKGARRDLRKEQFWRRLLGEWRASKVSARAFCAARGLAEASLYWWQRQLAQRDAEACHFIPVRLAEEPPTRLIELVLPGARTIRVPPGFDAATLRQLLTVLEEKPC